MPLSILFLPRKLITAFIVPQCHQAAQTANPRRLELPTK